MAQMEESLARALRWESTSERDGAADTWREFEAVYTQCFPAVLRYTLGRVGDRAVTEDLVGDIFERAWWGWPGFHGRSQPCTWILGIARHVIADHFRRAPLSLSSLDEAGVRVDSGAATTEELAQRREERRELLEAISRLPDADRDLLAMRYGADLPFKEVAEVLGIGEAAARMRVQRVLGRLRTLLREENEA